MIVPRLVREAIALARKHKKIITVDPKEDHFDCYNQVSLITPNHYEAVKAMGKEVDSACDLEKMGRALLDKLKSQAVLVTLGEEGMLLLEDKKPALRIPTFAQEVFDVSGAGDTVIATATCALASGASMAAAAHISNTAAGIVVGKVGVTVATQEELLEKFSK